jgi:hypothetical protein
MTLLFAMATVSCTPTMAQEDLWGRVTSADTRSIRPLVVTPSQSQQQSVAKLLKSRRAPWTCNVDEPKGEWLNNLRYWSVPLSTTDRVLLVEAGPGWAETALQQFQIVLQREPRNLIASRVG